MIANSVAYRSYQHVIHPSITSIIAMRLLPEMLVFRKKLLRVCAGMYLNYNNVAVALWPYGKDMTQCFESFTAEESIFKVELGKHASKTISQMSSLHSEFRVTTAAP